jgi:TolB-like protein/Tfp pilus assembly protein PilF
MRRPPTACQGVVPPVTEPSHAVFLSYASQDAEAAHRICEALRAAGIEVFLDQSELRGGDAWDQKIRHEIHDCALFIPVISANTASRHEGYFRLEWDLADQRTHMMARNRVFIVPVCLDRTPEAGADVPESFQRVQWTRLPGGVTPTAFVERLRRLLSGELSQAPTWTASAAAGVSAAPTTGKAVVASWRSKAALLATIAVLVLALGYLATNRLVLSKGGAEVGAAPAPAAQSASVTAFAPPPHSIAVLPFVNMSGDKGQEYFSDGLTEEMLNSLARINELQVAARTSSFYFKGKDTDIGTIARKLNVGAILEGSVRRSGHMVRVTAQLNNAVSGFHLWSQTYDRDLRDILKLQTEIANAVAESLKVTLLGDLAAKIEVGGTRNPAAFDAYLLGSKALGAYHDQRDEQAAIRMYTEAIRLDPNYALAFAARSIAYTSFAWHENDLSAVRKANEEAQADAHHAIMLAPELAEGHLALAVFLQSGPLDFPRASEAYERARALAPGNPEVLRQSGMFAVLMGHFDAGVSALRRAVMLDPLNPRGHVFLGMGLLYSRRYEEAVAAFTEAISLDPDKQDAYGNRGLAYSALGDYRNARSSCEPKPHYWLSQWCLAVVYEKLGLHTHAEAVFAAFMAADPLGDTSAYTYATIYAQWGNTSKALKWLDTAMRVRDNGLSKLKTEPFLDPLREEPRFQAIERELKFPD